MWREACEDIRWATQVFTNAFEGLRSWKDTSLAFTNVTAFTRLRKVGQLAFASAAKALPMWCPKSIAIMNATWGPWMGRWERGCTNWCTPSCFSQHWISQWGSQDSFETLCTQMRYATLLNLTLQTQRMCQNFQPRTSRWKLVPYINSTFSKKSIKGPEMSRKTSWSTQKVLLDKNWCSKVNKTIKISFWGRLHEVLTEVNQ